jgi:hypothetical protein
MKRNLVADAGLLVLFVAIAALWYLYDNSDVQDEEIEHCVANDECKSLAQPLIADIHDR